MSVESKIKQTSKILYPSGRAFWMRQDSFFDKLHTALGMSLTRAWNDAYSILNSALPDNTDFTTDDATDWERRLGMIYSPLVSLTDRKSAIQRKMAHPGNIKARQNWRYIEGQLQAAGFNVYVYENRFPDGFGGYTVKTPEDFSTPPFPVDEIQHGDVQHGDAMHGGSPGNKVANNIDADLDSVFSVTNLRWTFFIGGTPAGDWATVNADREAEFRQLVLRLKPVNTIAFLLVNFV